MQHLAILKAHLEKGNGKKKRPTAPRQSRAELEQELVQLIGPRFTKDQLRDIVTLCRKLLKLAE